MSISISEKNRFIVIKPSRKTFIIFSVFALLPSLGAIEVIEAGQIWSALFVFVLGNGLLLGPFLRIRVSWNDDTLVYRTTFQTQVVKLADVKRFEFKTATMVRALRQTFGLCIFSASSRKPVMIINVKPFSKNDVMRLTQKLESVTHA